MGFSSRILVPIGGGAGGGGDSVFSAMMQFPSLVGLWVMSEINKNTGTYYDRTGNSISLTNQGIVLSGFDGIVPYAKFDDALDYLINTAGNALTNVQGTELYIENKGLTFGGYCYFDNAPGTIEHTMGKTANPPSVTYYRLRRDTDGTVQFGIANTASVSINTTDILPTGEWIPVVAKWIPSTSVDIFYVFNSTKIKVSTSTSIASLNSAHPLLFGRGDSTDSSQRLTGKLSHQFLCASAIPDNTINNWLDLSISYLGI